MLPHHWCALSCAVTMKGASCSAVGFARKPIDSLKVMLPGKPWA
jgi:hypothetical protein